MASVDTQIAGGDAHTDATATTRASGSSFYLAMRVLPRKQREGMFEIYSFCRAVDDIADSDLPRAQRSAQLAHWRTDIEAIYAGSPPIGLQGLAQTVKQFAPDKEDFLAVIDGMEMDAVEDTRAPDWQTLDLYCDRVASAVGRLSVRVFGMEKQDGKLLAHHLGRALQLTNILRDLDEDAAIGRLYLPSDALRGAGIRITDPLEVIAHPALAAACAPVIERARAHFIEADKIMARAPRRVVRAPRMMERVYHGILEGMAARGWAAPRHRIRVGKFRLLGILLQHALI